MIVGKLILKSRLACSLPALEVHELAAATEAWSEILVDTVPSHRLNDAYILAMRSHDTNFAIGAPQIVAAWKEIRQSEISRPKPLSVDRQIVGDVCHRCNGTGTEIVVEGDYFQSKVCSH